MIRCLCMGFLALAFTTRARDAKGQKESVAVRQLAVPDAESTPDIVASIAAFRATSSGHVFINDVLRRQVVVLDSSLRLIRALTDADGTQIHYGNGATGLFAFRGDSTLFLSGASMSIVVMDANGAVGRAMAPPRPSDFGQLIGGAAGNPAFDARERLVYRAAGPTLKERIRLGQLNAAPPPDSAALVRFDFKERILDTIAYVRIYTPRIVPKTVQNGKMATTWMSQILNPMPLVDDWAILVDGTVAVLRGLDYHVDFFSADNVRTRGAKIPFSWRRLSANDKVALLDSSRALRARLVAQGIGVSRDAAPVPGTEPVTAKSSLVSTGPATAGGGQSSAEPPNEPPVEYVSADELPDYQPAFAVGSLRADQDGRLWVRTIPPQPLSGGAIYDVLDSRGTLIDRVQVPRNSAIAGFGPGGIIYLAQRDGGTLRLMRCRYRTARD